MLSDCEAEWLFDTFAWALRSFGTDRFYSYTRLVLPNDEFFPIDWRQPDDSVRTLFERVRSLAQMNDWECVLEAQARDANGVVAPGVVIPGAPAGPAGTFSHLGRGSRRAKITYNPSALKRPETLVSIFAHELSHFLAHQIEQHPPGGSEFTEHATDLVAVYLGFGLFMANSAFSFHQYSGGGVQGWVARRQGYLSEDQLTYALAIFCLLKGYVYRDIRPWLDSHLRSSFRKSLRDIKRHKEKMSMLQGIRALRLATPGM